MAGPMLLFCVIMSAVCMKWVLWYNDWSLAVCILFGAIISATDPVAVVALLKELGVSKRLGTMIEGESLLNDGTAYVIFVVLLALIHE